MSESGGIVTTYIFRIAFGQFWTWWTTRLGEALPRALVRGCGLESRPDYPEVDVADGPEVDVADGEGTAADSEAGAAVLIRLPARNVLVRSTRYPFQAAHMIPDLLAAEVDRFTPFDAADVVLAHRVVEYDWAAKEITVLFAAIRRDVLSRIFEKSLAAGHVPVGAVTHDGGLPLRFDQPGAGGNADGMGARRIGWMVAAAILFLTALALPSLLMEREYEQLSARLSEVRSSAEAGAGSVEQANRIENTRRFMDQKLGENLPPLVLLSELSRLIPRDSWITTLNLQGDKLSLQGNSAKASDVVTALAGSRLLREVQYQSSITRDPRSNMERFSISAVVVVDAVGDGEAGE